MLCSVIHDVIRHAAVGGIAPFADEVLDVAFFEIGVHGIVGVELVVGGDEPGDVEGRVGAVAVAEIGIIRVNGCLRPVFSDGIAGVDGAAGAEFRGPADHGNGDGGAADVAGDAVGHELIGGGAGDGGGIGVAFEIPIGGEVVAIGEPVVAGLGVAAAAVDRAIQVGHFRIGGEGDAVNKRTDGVWRLERQSMTSKLTGLVPVGGGADPPTSMMSSR